MLNRTRRFVLNISADLWQAALLNNQYLEVYLNIDYLVKGPAM